MNILSVELAQNLGDAPPQIQPRGCSWISRCAWNMVSEAKYNKFKRRRRGHAHAQCAGKSRTGGAC